VKRFPVPIERQPDFPADIGTSAASRASRLSSRVISRPRANPVARDERVQIAVSDLLAAADPDDRNLSIPYQTAHHCQSARQLRGGLAERV